MTKILRFLPDDEYKAAIGADSPSASNVFATMDDVKVTVVSVTIAVANWSGGTTCSKTVTGVTTTSINDIAIETIANGDAWAAANIYATGQSADQIDFTCTTTPTAAISFKVIINTNV